MIGKKMGLVLAIAVVAGGVYGLHMMGVGPVDSAFDLVTNPPLSIVASNSMAPKLQRGDVVYLDPVEPRRIERGDVVAFGITGAKRARYNYPSTIVHRVVGIEERDGTLWFQTAGDKTGKDPFKIVEYNARSRYTGFKVPRVGLVLLFLNTGRGRVWLLFSGVFLLSLKFVPDAWHGWRESKERTESIHEGVEELKRSGGREAEASDIVLRRDEFGDVAEVRRGGAGAGIPGTLNLVRDSGPSNARVGGGEGGE